MPKSVTQRGGLLRQCLRCGRPKQPAARLVGKAAGAPRIAVTVRGRRAMNVYPDTPGHRNVDTSIAAANALAPKLGRLQRMAEAAIREAGLYGLTADELAARLGMDRWSIQPRTSELRRKGLIRDSGNRRPNATGKQAIVWIAK